MCTLFGRMSLGFQSLWTSKSNRYQVFLKKYIYKELKICEWALRCEAPQSAEGEEHSWNQWKQHFRIQHLVATSRSKMWVTLLCTVHIIKCQLISLLCLCFTLIFLVGRVSWYERKKMSWMHVNASSYLGNEVTGTLEQTGEDKPEYSPGLNGIALGSMLNCICIYAGCCYSQAHMLVAVTLSLRLLTIWFH